MEPAPLSDAEVKAAAHVGRAMLKAMRQTKLPPKAQRAAAIHALVVVCEMVGN